MKKRYVISALGVGVAGIMLGSKQLSKNGRQEPGNRGIVDEDPTFLNAGKPDQVEDLELDQIENAKMVSEGSQFGVQYYNNVKEDS